MIPDKETIKQVVALYKQWYSEQSDQPLTDYVQEHWEERTDTAEVAANTFNDDIINELFGKTEQLHERRRTMTMKTNMAGLMRWHRNNPRKRLDGYFTVDGKALTHNQVLAALEYAIEHNCRNEHDIPTDIVEKIVKGEIVPKKGDDNDTQL